MLLYAFDGRIIRDYTLRCNVSRTGGLDVTPPFLPSGGSGLYLVDRVIRDALVVRNHPAFDDLLRDMDVYNMITQPRRRPYRMKSVDETIDVRRRVIHACGANAHRITGKVSTISTACDVLILDGDGVRPA